MMSYISSLAFVPQKSEISISKQMTYKCVTNPTTIYGSTLDRVFTGGHLPSIIYNGCYCSDHMTPLIQKKMQ
jgi:hypothetical protein